MKYHADPLFKNPLSQKTPFFFALKMTIVSCGTNLIKETSWSFSATATAKLIIQLGESCPLQNIGDCFIIVKVQTNNQLLVAHTSNSADSLPKVDRMRCVVWMTLQIDNITKAQRYTSSCYSTNRSLGTHLRILHTLIQRTVEQSSFYISIFFHYFLILL